MKNNGEITQLSGLYKILGDETRLRILLLLQQNELSVGELQQILEVGQSALSSQLAQLRDHSLVENRKEGQKVYYKYSGQGGTDGSTPTESALEISHNIISQTLEEVASTPLAAKDKEKLQWVLQQRSQNSTAFFNSLKGEEFRPPGQSFESLFLAFLQLFPQTKLVDLGCGSGTLTYILARSGKDVIGIDSSEKQIELANQKARNFEVEKKHQDLKGQLKFTKGYMEETGLKEKSAELVVLSQSLHHVAKPEVVIAEAFRILKPKGKLLILDLYSHQEDWMREQFGDFWLGFSADSLNKWTKQAGFEEGHCSGWKDSTAPQNISTLIFTATRP